MLDFTQYTEKNPVLVVFNILWMQKKNIETDSFEPVSTVPLKIFEKVLLYLSATLSYFTSPCMINSII
jgi:hypothetical protein